MLCCHLALLINLEPLLGNCSSRIQINATLTRTWPEHQNTVEEKDLVFSIKYILMQIDEASLGGRKKQPGAIQIPKASWLGAEVGKTEIVPIPRAGCATKPLQGPVPVAGVAVGGAVPVRAVALSSSSSSRDRELPASPELLEPAGLSWGWSCSQGRAQARPPPGCRGWPWPLTRKERPL